ncbi:MAG: hypothetical protein U5N58_04960 [Actinomycetota bacterium]|nr:hypothetical protein [Actinomycetota bacterium]
MDCSSCAPMQRRLSAKEQGGGGITEYHLCSPPISSTVPQWQCSYNASKAAAEHLVESLAVEWAPYHIRLQCHRARTHWPRGLAGPG